MNRKTSRQLHGAEAQCSAAVEAASKGKARLVTRRGEREVVALDAGQHVRLRQDKRARAPGFIEHLPAMPRPVGASCNLAGARPAIRLRGVVHE